MPAASDARHVGFARFVRRACDRAKTGRGWSVDDIAEHAGIGRSTIFRWLKGEWERDPLGDQVAAFCNALDIPPTVAFEILWPAKGAKQAAPEPLPLEPDFETLLRRLEDPHVSESEKFLIRETIRSLAARPTPRRRQSG